MFSCPNLAHLHAVAYHLACAQVFVGRHFEENGLQVGVVQLAVLVLQLLVHVGVADGADIVVEPIYLVGVYDLALHDQRRLLDDGCASSMKFTFPTSSIVPTTVAGVG